MTTTTSCPIRWLVTGRPLLSWPRRCVICKIVSPFLLCVQGTLFIRQTTTKQQEPSRTTDERPIERLATTRRAGDGGGGFDCHWLSFSFFFFSLRQLHVESSRAQFSEIKEKVALVHSFVRSCTQWQQRHNAISQERETATTAVVTRGFILLRYVALSCELTTATTLNRFLTSFLSIFFYLHLFYTTFRPNVWRKQNL